MTSVIIIFSIVSIISACIIGFILYKKLPNQNEKFKLVIPVIIGLIIGAIFCLFGMHTPTCEFGRFM